MQTRALGASGLQVSELGLGCNNFGGTIDEAETRAVVDAALDAGINFFDTANVYGNCGGSEILLGRILGGRRQDVILATKFGSIMQDGGRRDASRRYIMRAVEASLMRLKTDWIDVYYLHWPDPFTPVDETLRALDDLIHFGKVRYIGACNFAAWQLVDAMWIARELGLNHFICAQNEFSLVERGAEDLLLPALAAHGLGMVPYFPLAGGLLTSKYLRDQPPQEGTRFGTGRPALGELFLTPSNWDLVEELEAWCKTHGHSLVDLAVVWLLMHQAVSSVIAGATKPAQVKQNAAAVAWQLDTEEKVELQTLLKRYPRSGRTG